MEKLLIKAIHSGNLRAIKQLVEKKCFDVNSITTYNKGTALHLAIENYEEKITKFLIEHGADVNAQDRHGWTPLHFTGSYCHIDIARLLIENGADVNIQDDHLRTPLHIACFWGPIEIIKLFIENGADITPRDKFDLTPLDGLKRHHPQEYEELIQWLSENHPEKALEYMVEEKRPGSEPRL